jgi:hypothetical protein
MLRDAEFVATTAPNASELKPTRDSLYPFGGDVKRNWDLIRDLMLAVEDLPAGAETLAERLRIVEAYDLAEIQNHAELLIEAGLLKGDARHTIGGGLRVRIAGLTMAGHDWLASIRSESVWAETKGLAKTKGLDLTFDLVKAIAIAFLKSHLGLSE